MTKALRCEFLQVENKPQRVHSKAFKRLPTIESRLFRCTDVVTSLNAEPCKYSSKHNTYQCQSGGHIARTSLIKFLFDSAPCRSRVFPLSFFSPTFSKLHFSLLKEKSVKMSWRQETFINRVPQCSAGRCLMGCSPTLVPSVCRSPLEVPRKVLHVAVSL